MFWPMVMALWPEKNEKTVKGDQCNPSKDLSTVKLVFSLKHKDKKLWIVELTSGEWDLILL